MLGLPLAATFAAGYLVSRARAAGIPASQPLAYSGVLTDTSGTPLTGSKNILVQFYDQPTAGNTQCTIGPMTVTLTAGAFSIALPDTCTAAVHASTDLWVDVFVDGNSLGRSKLGAVPYAVEAAAATAASHLLLKSGAQTLSVGPCCGSTPATTGNISAPGGLTGYAAARALCQTACSAPAAHMCSGAELTWTLQLGIPAPPAGWVATGILAQYSAGGYIGDCGGWTTASSISAGGTFTNTTSNYNTCNGSLPVLCCD
jgi:hypothetical protein